MKFTREIGDSIAYGLLKTPDMETKVKLKIQDFLAKPYNTVELYDFLIDVYKTAKDYEPPEADEARIIDLEWCEAHT
jgi:YesN/AraC family two-component response regulator